MVLALNTPDNRGAMELFAVRYDRAYARRLNEITYDRLVRQTRIQSAAYLFCDFQRMGPGFRALLKAIWDRMEALEPSVRLLNNPHRQLDRFTLLKKLHADGLNDFNVHWVSEAPASMRFPVFIRVEHDHQGPRTDLLHDEDAFNLALSRLILEGHDPATLIAVEYCEARDDDGLFRKYGAFRIGDRIVCQHIFFATDWMVKVESMIRTDTTRDLSNRYFLENEHGDQLMPLFEAANIDYGRIDYGMKDGKVQVWEINDCPVFTRNSGETFSQLRKDIVYMEAFDKLSEGLDPAARLDLDLSDLDVLNIVREACK